MSDLDSIIYDLEYAAHNLCKDPNSKKVKGVMESTCPEKSLYIAIRNLKEIAKNKGANDNVR